MEIKCEKCWQKGRSNKNGKTRDVSQRYRCKHCEKNNTPIKKERMYPEELKDRAIELYMEGNSGRTVGRLLKISKNMCLRWIQQKAKKIKPKDSSNERVEVIGIHELFSFNQRIQNLVDNAPKAEFYFSDAFPVYSQICYEGVYRALDNKSQTFTLESVNADSS